MSQNPIRRNPRAGTVIRTTLGDGYFYYCCVVCPVTMWLYNFRTMVPASGGEFFDRKHWRWGIRLYELPREFVNCGLLKLAGLPSTYSPRIYRVIPDYRARSLGFRYNTVVQREGSMKCEDFREVSPEEIEDKGHASDTLFCPENYREIIAQYIPRMELREVPPRFVDKRDPVSLSMPVKEPKLFSIRVTLRELDLATDDIEPDIEDPLQEAVEEAECGKWVFSGTAPGGLYDIDFETVYATRAKCLKVIERTLKKLGCLNAATIEVAETT